MRTVLSLLFLIFSIVLYAQNKVDSQGKRQGVWVKKYRNGNIRYKGQFEHGKEVGTFKFYAVTGEKNPIVVKEFNPNNDLAFVRFYSTKGVLESEGKMQGKKRIGIWMYYFKDGKTILSTEEYKGGVLDGEVKTFYKSGKLTEIAHYKNGKLHGKHIRYSDEGKPVEDLTYKNGIMHGPAIIYDEKGEVFARGNYENGYKSGIWEFNMDGEMVKSAPDKVLIKK